MALTLTKEEAKIVLNSLDDFPYFIDNIFSKSFVEYVDGSHPRRVGKKLQNSNRTIRVSARNHFKSTSLYALFMWKLLKNAVRDEDMEYFYFSFNTSMSEYHIGKIKGLIRENPFFRDLRDAKETADSVCKYTWGKNADGRTYYTTLSPHSLIGFKRGLHCNGGIFVDDPFQDPTSKIEPKTIRRINDVMKTQVIDIPIRDAFIHVVGTAQTKEDFYFDKNFTARFDVDVHPAILDFKTKEVLWKEWMDFEELMAKMGERGKKVFYQEYMCEPYYSENTFISRDDITRIQTLSHNRLLSEVLETDKDVIAGYDIGKKVHPAFFSVFHLVDKKWKQVHFRFFDNVDYQDQISYIEDAIEAFGIDTVFYDNTRGELESFAEKDELPAEFEPVVFSKKIMTKMATELDVKITNDQIELIKDARQEQSFLSVMNDLQTIENSAGHGEAFWTTCMALMFAIEVQPTIY